MKFWYCTYLEFLTYLTCPCGFIEVKRQSSYHGSQKIKKWTSRAKYLHDFNIRNIVSLSKLGMRLVCNGNNFQYLDTMVLMYQFYLKRNRIVGHLA